MGGPRPLQTEEVQTCWTENHELLFPRSPIAFRLGKRASPPTHISSCCRYCVPAHWAAVEDARVHTVIPADFHIIQRNVSVGVGLFYAPGRSHRHTLSVSPSTSHFLYHTLHFLSSHTDSHTAFVLLRSSCCPLALWFLPCWLFCWQTSAGCHGWDRGGILSV